MGLNPCMGKRDYPILEDKPPLDVFFCDSIEAAVTLAEAGYGIALVPDLLQNDHQEICRLPIIDAEPMSYGVYYKTLSDHPRQGICGICKGNLFPESL